jgi:hypothetical protein
MSLRAAPVAVGCGAEPRIVEAKLSPAGVAAVLLGQAEKQAREYLLQPQLGILGVLASAVGKKPADYRYWILEGDVPAFLAFEGPLYVGGPIRRVELASARWPKKDER